MKLQKSITYRGSRWNEIGQDFDLSDSGTRDRFLTLTRPVSESAIRRNKVFVSSTISVKMTDLLASPKLSDDVIHFVDQMITHRIRNGAFVTDADLRAICAVTINSELRAELDKRGQCDYCASSDSGHNVHCRNFMREH